MNKQVNWAIIMVFVLVIVGAYFASIGLKEHTRIANNTIYFSNLSADYNLKITNQPQGIVFNADYITFKDKDLNITFNHGSFFNFDNVSYITFNIDNKTYTYLRGKE